METLCLEVGKQGGIVGIEKRRIVKKRWIYYTLIMQHSSRRRLNLWLRECSAYCVASLHIVLYSPTDPVPQYQDLKL